MPTPQMSKNALPLPSLDFVDGFWHFFEIKTMSIWLWLIFPIFWQKTLLSRRVFFQKISTLKMRGASFFHFFHFEKKVTMRALWFSPWKCLWNLQFIIYFQNIRSDIFIPKPPTRAIIPSQISKKNRKIWRIFSSKYYRGGLGQKITTKNTIVNRIKHRYDHKYCRKSTGLGGPNRWFGLIVGSWGALPWVYADPYREFRQTVGLGGPNREFRLVVGLWGPNRGSTSSVLPLTPNLYPQPPFFSWV